MHFYKSESNLVIMLFSVFEKQKMLTRNILSYCPFHLRKRSQNTLIFIWFFVSILALVYDDWIYGLQVRDLSLGTSKCRYISAHITIFNLPNSLRNTLFLISMFLIFQK